jgi:4-hydroxy-tetrahydrodipicolinate reductase
MKNKPRVIVAGAFGKMGKSAIETFLQNSDSFHLVAGVVRDLNNIPKETKDFYLSHNLTLSDNLEEQIHLGADVLVELTTPDSVFENSKLALRNGVRPVIGATGLNEDDINELSSLANKSQTGAIIAPNFAIGAILMMKFSAIAAKYMKNFEIIEMHHDKKADAPSGTALKTAQMISKNISGSASVNVNDEAAARGEKAYNTRIHSVRLPGLVAHQEVIFGGQGQTLTIRHDSIDRSSFMPGILLACQKVMELDKLVYGLDSLI